jgi:hypothetical protein
VHLSNMRKQAASLTYASMQNEPTAY